MKSSFLILAVIFVFTIYNNEVSADPLKDLQTTIDIQEALSNENLKEATELLDQFSDKNMHDIWSINIIQKFLSSNPCTNDIKGLLYNLNDQNLKDIWTINALQNTLQVGTCDRLSLKLLTSINNQNLKDIWAANVVQMSMDSNKCNIGYTALGRIKNKDLHNLWRQNVERSCNSTINTSSNNDEPYDYSQVETLIAEISLKIPTIKWSKNSVSKISDKLSKIAAHINQLEQKNKKKITSPSINRDVSQYSIVCISKDDDGLGPYSFALRDGLEIKKKYLVTYRTMAECNATISIQDNVEDNTYICASRDNDGLRPYEVLIVASSNFEDRYIKTNVIPGSKDKCNQALIKKVKHQGIDHMCASKDGDGLRPYGLFRIGVNIHSSLIGGVFNSFESCLNSL